MNNHLVAPQHVHLILILSEEVLLLTSCKLVLNLLSVGNRAQLEHLKDFLKLVCFRLKLQTLLLKKLLILFQFFIEQLLVVKVTF